ncbi:MAG: propanediol/glycerol family dehydratase large subunit, partial [Bryobacteraceae bacterium]
MTSRRSQARAQRPIHRDTFIEPWPEAGLVLFHSPWDPPASLHIEAGRIVELDGKKEAEFDALDRFIARHAIDCEVAPEAMAIEPRALARMLADINVPRAELVRLCGGLTPARLMQVVSELSVLEMMMALAKMRARRTPANQAHVTNRKENPALLAADAAEAAERGFAELETTVGVSRYAPLNALAVLVGSQTGHGAALTQCAVEESLGLRLALLGLTTYAETLSVY